MPKAFSETEKELIGRRLLEQGHKQFSAFGLKKTNIEEISKAAGISKGAFYSFYESKEALFMDVIEQIEIRVRQEILAVVDLPGPTPRARLLAILKKAFTFFREVPLLRFFTGEDFDLLFRRLPVEKFQQHLASDLTFFEELIVHCQQAGIPIRAPTGQIAGLLYPLVLAILHEEGPSRNSFTGNIDLFLELVAAFCLGEIEIQNQTPASLVLDLQEGIQK
jgi:AcrR family transcriptional regulator